MNRPLTAFVMMGMALQLGCGVEPTSVDEDTNRLVTDTDTDKDSDGIPDTDIPVDTDRDSDGIPDTDTPSSIDTATTDTETDTGVPGPSWLPPVPRQTGLASYAITCDAGDLTSDCASGAPSPCVPDDPKILCDMVIQDETGALVYNGRIGIERRGRSSINYHKPNYSLEFRMADGVTENPVACMGMGKEEDWILDGSWMDRSFMRNDLVFDIYRGLGDERYYYAPEARYGELTFNGEHRGIYRLVERIKRDDDRIIMDTDDGSGSRFIIKQDEAGDLYDNLQLEYNVWQFVYPNEDVVTSTQHDAVQQWLSSFSAALNSGRAFDYLDMATTVDWVLMQEFAKNVDGFNLSIHLFKNGDGPAYLVPWDIDLAFGQPTFQWDPAYRGYENPDGWAREMNFNASLVEDPAFATRLVTRWAQLRQGPLSDAWVTARIDQYQQVLNATAIAENFAVFPIEDVDFAIIWPAYTIYDVTSYADEVAHLRQWITARLAFMDANIGAYGK